MYKVLYKNNLQRVARLCFTLGVTLFACWGLSSKITSAAEIITQTDLFKSGADGYHTYRIPAIVSTNNGTLLAFCEGRKNKGSDAGDIDLLLKRSTDGGETWSPQQVVWDDGENTCGNPCPVVDRSTGTIWLLMTHNLGDDHEKDIIASRSKGSRTVWVSKSDDEGQTWSDPRDITATTKQPDWTWYATGPGAGIQMTRGKHKGRLVIPCDHIEKETKNYYSHAIFSDDHGATWKLGASTPKDRVNECEVVELEEGRLMLNMRNYDREKLTRQVAISDDGGASWKDQRHDKALIEPICQASVRRLRWPNKDKPGVLLFSNPASQKGRKRMTVRASYDEGKTWPVSRVIYPGAAAYSCLVAMPNGEIGCFYEADKYKRIVFAKFSMNWLVHGKKKEAYSEAKHRGFSIPQIDLNDRADLQTIVSEHPKTYMGHPSSVLLEDGKTMVMMYLNRHGRGHLMWRRSEDGGHTWSNDLPLPKGWDEPVVVDGKEHPPFLEIPILYNINGQDGKQRICMYTSGRSFYPARYAVSEDKGKTWSKLEPILFDGKELTNSVVLFSDMIKLKDGRYLATYHSRGAVYTATTSDGIHFDAPVVAVRYPNAHPCEGCFIRSPDGKTIALLLRENKRKHNSLLALSDDEGKTWSEPRQLPDSLTGDRHQHTYTPDGRLFISFRDMGAKTKTRGDWIGWVGAFDDIVSGREGEYRVRLKDNFKGADCGYPTQHRLPDGTIFAATYGRWIPGKLNSILAYHFKIEDFDKAYRAHKKNSK